MGRDDSTAAQAPAARALSVRMRHRARRFRSDLSAQSARAASPAMRAVRRAAPGSPIESSEGCDVFDEDDYTDRYDIASFCDSFDRDALLDEVLVFSKRAGYVVDARAKAARDVEMPRPRGGVVERLQSLSRDSATRVERKDAGAATPTGVDVFNDEDDFTDRYDIASFCDSYDKDAALDEVLVYSKRQGYVPDPRACRDAREGLPSKPRGVAWMGPDSGRAPLVERFCSDVSARFNSTPSASLRSGTAVERNGPAAPEPPPRRAALFGASRARAHGRGQGLERNLSAERMERAMPRNISLRGLMADDWIDFSTRRKVRRGASRRRRKTERDQRHRGGAGGGGGKFSGIVAACRDMWRGVLRS